MEEKKIEKDPFQQLNLIKYQMEEDFKNPDAYDEKIRSRYRELIEAIKKQLPNNAKEVMKKCRKLDEAYNQICTREKRIAAKDVKIKYLQNREKITKQYRIGDRTFYISQVGTLKFSEETNVEHSINRYLLTIVNVEEQSVEKETILSTIDLERIEKDSEYREFVLLKLFSQKSLESARDYNYGYIGEPIQDEKGQYGIKYERSALSASQKDAKQKATILEKDKDQQLL